MRTAREIPKARDYLDVLEERLPEKTLRHTISVAEMAMEVAGREGIDPLHAGTAGLLHDLCKATKSDVQLQKAERYGVELTPVRRENPKLLHGPVAAEEARRLFSVTEPAVLEAIAWHTTGRAGLGPIGQALYYCDFSEPLRDYPEAAEARAEFAREGLHAAVRFVARHKLRYARGKKSSLDPHTEAFYRWLHGEAVSPRTG